MADPLRRSSRTLALFDFDGTLTRSDSFYQFIVFSFGRWRSWCTGVRLLPTLVGFVLGSVTNAAAKEKALTVFYRHWSRRKFEATARRFAEERIPGLFRPAALEKLRWHKRQGHTVVVVSASPDVYLQPWGQREKIEVLATRLEYRNGKVTGALASANCYGPEKVRRIRESVDLSRFSHIVAYGDSAGDREMLALAQERYYNWKKM